jgi:GNAT superfamily N-acetyltransferase
MTVEIRRIHVDEWRDLRDLRLRALSDAPDAFGSTYEQEAEEPERGWIDRAVNGAEGGSSFTVVALDDDRWIAMAMGAPHRDHPGEAGLFAMWVAPDARRAGIGGALVEHVVSWARSRAFPVLRLRVTRSNDGAMRLYERCGFIDEGVRLPLRDGSGVMTTSMTMDLSA